jgi:hypothetical protein
MAGLVPAIHVFGLGGASKTWMPATSAGMTIQSNSIAFYQFHTAVLSTWMVGAVCGRAGCVGLALLLPAIQAASSRISRTCAGPSMRRGFRGTQGVCIAPAAMISKLSRPMPTAPRLRGMPSASMK